jgi:membrane-associated phospholipid phosphatase
MGFGIAVRFWVCVALCWFLAASACWPQSPPQSQQSDGSSSSSGNSKKTDAKAEKKEGDTQPDPSADNADSDPSSDSHPGFRGLAEDFLNDQKQIWTSPAKLRFSDAQWLVPLSGITATLFATDTTFSKHLSHNPATTSHYDSLSNAGLGALLGGAGGMWLLGHVKHNSHWTETGFLAGEAALNSLVVVEAMSYGFGRERPYQDNGSGSFFSGGTSFPSEHAALAWSAAGVIAHEYHGPLTKLAVYSLAALVDFSRIRARQHFPSDVFVGDIIGNFVAQDVYTSHHDPELGGETWRSFSAAFHDLNSSAPSIPAAPFVPLDSWVYAAIERLSAEGFINSTFLGSRPWTRIECARLTQEAGDRLQGVESSNPSAERLYEQLYTEFNKDLAAMSNGGENQGKIESLYADATQIVGTPLNDSRHFGQTIINDFGRPYQQGFNTDDGFSAWAADGRYAIYVRGEYQHAPAAPGFSQPVQNLISTLDSTPPQTASPIASTDQFALLDTYVSTAVGGWNFSFGKQSLWWGQAEGGALIFSDNAAPIYMFRASRTVPIVLPWIFRHLGPIKVDAFVGKLSGLEFPPRPILHGEKISFKPTKNLELAFSRLAEMGGAAIPGVNSMPNAGSLCPFGLQRAITLGALFHSYFSVNESNLYPCNANPGKRTAGFEFSYRLPFLRNWVTLYSDSLSPDDVSPVSAPRRAAVEPGIYISHFPKLSKLDLHVEATNTNTPSSSVNGQFVYFDDYYHDLSTNKGNIIGSWVGREGLGLQAWTTYSFSARTSLQFGYRHLKVAPDFVPRGETLNDAYASANFLVRNCWQLSASVQYEQWLAPVLSPTPQTDWTSSIGISFQPRNWSLPFHPGRDTSAPAKDGTP